MTLNDLSTKYPFWRTEMLSPDCRPLVNGQKGRMYVGLTDSEKEVHAPVEIELQGLSPAQIEEVGGFYTQQWHSWEAMPQWIKSAVEDAAKTGARATVVAAPR